MKKLTFIIAAFAMLCLAATSRAQTPQAIKYQAIARNSSEDVIANQNVSFRISILEGSAQGNTVYEEIQAVTTNQFGLANLSIGQGSVVSGIFDSIKWGNDTYFAKIEFDPTGGSNFAVMGTSQLLAVPYSLYSAHAKVADNMPVFPLKAALQATNLQAPFDEPETGLLVYNTDSAGASPYNVVPGYYYNAGTATDPDWVLLSTAANNLNNNHNKQLPDACNYTTQTTFGDCAGIYSTGAGYYDNGYGYGALDYLSTGQANSAFGLSALQGPPTSSVTGDYNTAVGSVSSCFTTSASSNTSVGSGSLEFNNGDANTAVGDSAMASNTTGTQNVAVGYQALAANTASVNNVAVGYQAVGSGGGGVDMTAVGYQALFNNAGGAWNTAIGSGSMYNITYGRYNTAVGFGSLYSSTCGGAYYNTAMGVQTLYYNTTGYDNVADGYQALYENTNGYENTASGAEALINNITGYANTAVGLQALGSNTVGTYNTAVGVAASYLNVSGTYNTALGLEALLNNTSSYNTAVGFDASYLNVSGTYNTALGVEALFTNTGSYNTAVGYDADVIATGSVTNATAIGYDAQVCSSNSMVFGNGSVSTWGFGMCPSNCNSNAIFAVNLPSMGTGIYMDNTGNRHSCSDRNKKENFKAVDGELLLNKIDKLPITQWNYKFDSTKTQHIGPMAQDFYKIFQVGNDSLTIATIDPAGIALAGIQALNRKLESENAELKAQITLLAQNQANTEKKMAELKASIGSASQQQASIK